MGTRALSTIVTGRAKGILGILKPYYVSDDYRTRSLDVRMDKV